MKALVADDDPVLRRMLETFLRKWGYDVVVASTGDAAWQFLQQEDAPRLAVLDWLMPGMDGVQICREARKRASQAYLYLLLLSSKGEQFDILDGFDSGADDYLIKPFHPDELKARLRVGQRILELEDQLRAAQQVLQFKATHDGLTSLWNRAAILEQLSREVPRARREGNPLGVLLADLDHFKSVNDGHGHLAGDEVLREAARRMTRAVRAYDAVGRYGGEEFIVILPGCDLDGARERAQQLRRAIESAPVQTDSSSVQVTLSIGAVSTGAWPSADVDKLIWLADSALYRAKQQGRNCVVVALPDAGGPAAPAPLDELVPSEPDRH